MGLEQIKGTEKAVEIARQGGSVKSPEKQLASQLRGLKLASTSEKKNEIVERIAVMLLNPLFAEAELLRVAESLKTENLTVNQKIRLLEVLNKTHSTVFGNKIQTNVSLQEKDLIERMLDEVLAKSERTITVEPDDYGVKQ